jgi:hypothetical protein
LRPPGNGTPIQDPIRDPCARYPAHHAAITATGLLEHLTKPEVFQTFDDVAAETGMLRGHIVTQNVTFAARKAAVTVKPGRS